MTTFNGTPVDDVIDFRLAPAPSGGAGAHFAYGYEGNDMIRGSAYDDLIFGGAGQDTLEGNGGDDLLSGGAGNDINFGGAGNDSIYDEGGNDTLDGGAGNDILRGGIGGDQYQHSVGGGIDVINDDKSPSGTTGNGGGVDKLLVGYTLANLEILSDTSNNNLYITSASDWADGVIDEGIIIEDFHLGGNNLIETLVTSDNWTVDLSMFLV